MKETEKSPSDSSSSRNATLWLVLISLGSITYLTGYYFVPTLQTRSTELLECPQTIYNFLSYTCKEFDIKTHPIIAMEISGITPSHQFVALEAIPILPKGSNHNKVTIKAEVNMFSVTESKEILTVFEGEKEKTVSFTHAEKDQKDYYPQSLGAVTQTKDSHYIFVIKLLNTDEIQANQVQDIKLGFVTLNPTFEQHLRYFKGFLFTVAIISWALYASNMSKLPQGTSSSEQAIVNLMGFTLILFDQPFLSYSYLTSNFPVMSATLTVTAIQTSAIIAVWFSVLERLSSSTNTISTLGKWAIGIYTLGHFILILTAYGVLAFDQIKDPMLDFHSDPSLGVTLSKYYLYVIGGIGLLWTLVRMCQVLQKFRGLDWRDNSAFTFSFYYVLCYIFFLVTGSLQVVALKGARVVLLYGITTLYTVLLQVIYATFTKEVEAEKRRAKYDNKKVRSQYDDLNMTDDPSPSVHQDTTDFKQRHQLQVDPSGHEEEEEEYDDEHLGV